MALLKSGETLRRAVHARSHRVESGVELLSTGCCRAAVNLGYYSNVRFAHDCRLSVGSKKLEIPYTKAAMNDSRSAHRSRIGCRSVYRVDLHSAVSDQSAFAVWRYNRNPTIERRKTGGH
jgi:hypothetical protein